MDKVELRELIHAMRVEYWRLHDSDNEVDAFSVYKITVPLLWMLPEVVQCDGNDLTCTVRGIKYSIPRIECSKTVADLIHHDLWEVSEEAYLNVVESLEKMRIW